MRDTAFAKINLALHVRHRRRDGYHEIETLFAFVDAGDEITARPAERDELTITGEFAGQLADPFANLVARALSTVPRSTGLAVTLEKNLPVAAGLGGGSADAGAMFRILRETQPMSADWERRAAVLGADVPACIESRTAIGRGTGTVIEPVDDDMAGIPVLLVNPRVPLATGPVFAAWDGKDRGPLPTGPASAISQTGRNDLQPPAIALCPVIAEVLACLQDTDASLVRMSGSGATCFALYPSEAQRQSAANAIASAEPAWWQMQGKLR